MLKLYRILWVIFYPIAKIIISIRIRLGKEDSIRFKEKFAEPTIQNNYKNIIWVHAVSIGEVLSAITFIERFKKDVSDDYTFLLTTVTTSSRDIVNKKKLKNVIHQFAPLDHVPIARKFLSYWNPKFVVFIESEIWPNIITEIKTPIFLVNARLTEKSFKRWKLVNKMFSKIIPKFSMIFAQSKESCENFSYFIPKYIAKNNTNVICAGNIKYSSAPLPVDENLFNIFQNEKHKFVAVSTHSGEEEVILNAFKKIIDKEPNSQLFIIPRHPNRANEVFDLINKNGFSCVLRSTVTKSDDVNDSINVICVDSFGEVGTFFKLADIVFVGGSLINIGGHNIFEPVASGKPVMFGNYMFNFEEMKNFLVECKVGFETKNELEISEIFLKYILNDDFKKITNHGLDSMKSFDPLAIILDNIKNIIQK